MPTGGASLHAEPSSILPTGVPDLDVILGGGLPRGSLIFLIGAPGAGKTLLAMQVACHTVQRGAHVLVLTALSEPHSKLLSHVGNFSFYDSQKIGDGLELLNLETLLAASAEESVAAIIQMVRRNRTSLLVIDGFGGASWIFAVGLHDRPLRLRAGR